MDFVLLTLAGLSLAAACGFGVLSWRVGREQREREHARISALSDAMNPPSPLRGIAATESGADMSIATRVAVGSVFDRATEGLHGRPTIKLAVGGVMALAIVLGGLIGAYTSGAASPDGNTVAVAAQKPLELMSMRHHRQGTTLTVSGLVRNPPGGSAVNTVTAVVFAFDRSGGFIGSGRAALDFSALAPGDESPFIVNVANASDVARYRVTFRSGDSVVRHIDRRGTRVQLAQAVR